MQQFRRILRPKVSSFGSHGASATSLRASLKLTANHSAKWSYLRRNAMLTILFWTGNFSFDTSVRRWTSSLLSWGFWSLLLESVRGSDCDKSFKMASEREPAFTTHAHIYQLQSRDAGGGTTAKWASYSVLSVHQSRAFLLLRIYLSCTQPCPLTQSLFTHQDLLHFLHNSSASPNLHNPPLTRLWEFHACFGVCFIVLIPLR